MKNLLLLCFLLAATGCKKRLEPCFKTNKNAVVAGEKISFENCSIDGEHFEWDFGDGTTSSISSPSHSYDENGTYTVTLQAFDKKRYKVKEFTQTITVGDLYITKITLRNYSDTVQWGYYWDNDDGPDIYIEVNNATLAKKIGQTSVFKNVMKDQLPLSWTTDWHLPRGMQFDIEVMDEDNSSWGTDRDYMIGYGFDPYTSARPSELIHGGFDVLVEYAIRL